MMAVLIAVAPSYWQRTLFGFVALVALLPMLALLLVGFRKSVLDPWVARRRWPEGAGWGALLRVPAELIADVQRSMEAARSGTDFGDEMVSLRVAAAFAAFAVIPASTGLVIAQPGLGVFVLPLCIVVDAIALFVATRPGSSTFELGPLDRASSGDEGAADGLEPAAVRVGAACLLALAGLAVEVQWGTARMSGVVHAQAHAAVASIAGWGLPTAVVQAPSAVVAVCAVYLLAASLSDAPGPRASATARGTALHLADALWVIAGSAWIVVCFAGGGGVPWTIANDGVRHVVSAVLLLSKTVLLALAITWIVALRPTVSRLWARRTVLGGSAVIVASIVVTALARALL